MDNETSKEIEDFIHSQQTGLQYPCCNMPTKKPLQASRKNSSHLQSLFQINHSVVSIPEFPTSHWCKLINQVDFAVNIVRPCRQKPRLSVWAACNGGFHFDSAPIAPPGTAMLMHAKPENRSSFGFNAKKAYYIGPCFKCYRTFRELLPLTWGKRLTDSVKFKHHATVILTKSHTSGWNPGGGQAAWQHQQTTTQTGPHGWDQHSDRDTAKSFNGRANQHG